MTGDTWTWDPSLFGGSASYYSRGRLAYPVGLADSLTKVLRLDRTGRLLDVGCGPGSLTLLLAGRFASVVGVDADGDMVAEAARLATAAGVGNARWVHLRAEELPAGLGTFRLVTFAQSFHWMDRLTVATTVRDMVEPGGACVHVHATTHRGVDGVDGLPHPAPPHQAIAELVRAYLGPTRRAGQGQLPDGTADDEAAVYRAAGFTGPLRLEIPGTTVARRADDVVASVFSLSSSAPHLFGDRRAAFETDLRRLLDDASPSGLFSERTREIAVDIWQP